MTKNNAALLLISLLCTAMPVHSIYEGVIPIQVYQEDEKNLVIGSDYHVRKVVWVSKDIMKIGVTPEGQYLPDDLFIDLSQNSKDSLFLMPAPPSELLELCAEEHKNIKSQGYLKRSSRNEESWGMECHNLPLEPRSLTKIAEKRGEVLSDNSGITLIPPYGIKTEYQFDRRKSHPALMKKGRTVTKPKGARDAIALFRKKNGHWGIYQLEKSTRKVKMIAGPSTTAKGFVPESLSLSPDGKRVAWIGPKSDHGMWGVSMINIEECKSYSGTGGCDHLVRKVAIKGKDLFVSYTGSRGFDYPVTWTGNNSILLLSSNGLQINHIKDEKGRWKTIGVRKFKRGDKLRSRMRFSSKDRSNRVAEKDFDLLRFETLSGVRSGNNIHVALSGILNLGEDSEADGDYIANEISVQTALPVIMELSWGLN